MLRFWLDRGVDGFRVDVAHGLLKEATLRDQIVADGEEPGSGVELFETFSMAEPVLRDEPMWDQPELHDVYRRWHKVLAEYPGDRMNVAEAWTQTPKSMARFVRADEMSQAFNFSWLLAPWSAVAFAVRHPQHLRGARRGRRCADVGAEQPRRGPARRRGTAAGRSASPAPARRR